MRAATHSTRAATVASMTGVIHFANVVVQVEKDAHCGGQVVAHRGEICMWLRKW